MDQNSLSLKFSALAHVDRLRLLALLHASEEPIVVTYASQMLEMSNQMCSVHLNLLHRAGLVSRQETGKWVLFRLNRGEFKDVVEVLSSWKEKLNGKE